MARKAVIGAIAIIIVAAIGYYLLGGARTTGEAALPAASSSTIMAGTPAQVSPPNIQALIGTWKSTDDAKFTRTFSANGTVTDAYQGEASATESGPFIIVDPAYDSDFPADPVNFTGLTVIRADFATSGPMYFAVTKLDSTSLQMTYVGRGNTLSFMRVQ